MRLINHIKTQIALLNNGNFFEKKKALNELKSADKATRDFAINCGNDIKEGDCILFLKPSLKDISYLSNSFTLTYGYVKRVSSISCTLITEDNKKLIVKIRDITSVVVFRKRWRNEDRRSLI